MLFIGNHISFVKAWSSRSSSVQYLCDVSSPGYLHCMIVISHIKFILPLLTVGVQVCVQPQFFLYFRVTDSKICSINKIQAYKNSHFFIYNIIYFIYAICSTTLPYPLFFSLFQYLTLRIYFWYYFYQKSCPDFTNSR